MVAKRILLTGATGVVGGAVLRALRASGHQVLLIVRNPSKFIASSNLKILQIDLADISAELSDQIKIFQPEICIHAGWQGGQNYERNDQGFIEANMLASRTLLKMASDAMCHHWIEFGSQAEYSPNIEGFLSEDSPKKPLNRYGNAKLKICRDAKLFCSNNYMTFTWLRLFTCYGPEYKPSYIIPTLIKDIRLGELPNIREPRAVWDCLHADDLASGVLNVISHESPGGIFNLASGKGVSIGEMAIKISKILRFSRSDELREILDQHKAQPTLRVANIAKFSEKFNWKPRISIDEGLKNLSINY